MEGRQRQLLLVAAVVFLAGVVAAFVSDDGELDEDGAAGCAKRVAERLGHEVVRVGVDRASDAWLATAATSDALVRVTIRPVDGRVLDVDAFPGPLTREQRLMGLETDCSP